MKDLLSKVHYCYKIHTLLMTSSAYLLFYRHHTWATLQFCKKMLIPPSMIFKKSQPSYNSINKRGGGGGEGSRYEYYM